MAIHFFVENISFKLTNALKVRRWIKEIILQENYQLGELNFIFCNDEYLHKINVEYLAHDDYTDIITFDNSDEKNLIEGDIFISVERVKENAQNLQVSFEQELQRVIIHGVLHLLGYQDKAPQEQAQMRAKEDEALKLFQTI
ncbi:rRNA maturation RNase YbeY [Raineya orbicola]|jgi:rRNA maturation RNase YbeY|uniref:Endoribonuclease YbeY n=1 Tax=Raineya orbicola TaxID=2016530 RepID=A0A2N3IHL1_9BACT|nr:rRNA maturation RNase YbeY [Raineya orbicola]PKQ69784.1 putative rRNA maturation factor YbeY [Raineya orbicola]